MKGRELPEFEAPPLIEVALGIQFKPLKKFRTPHVGLFWQDFLEEFPDVDEQLPLDSVRESFAKPRPAPRFSLDFQPLAPRILLSSADGTALIQVQRDRFICNWRKMEASQVYPRYDAQIRGDFRNSLVQFEAFLDRQRLGPLEPDQWEVTYVNVIDPKGRELSRVFSVLKDRSPEGFLPEMEDTRFALRYRIKDEEGQPFGRLHVALEPTVRVPGEEGYRLTLTARGNPRGKGTEEILRFIDLGHEWVVRGFAAITTPEMHEEWRRLK